MTSARRAITRTTRRNTSATVPSGDDRTKRLKPVGPRRRAATVASLVTRDGASPSAAVASNASILAIDSSSEAFSAGLAERHARIEQRVDYVDREVHDREHDPI